MRTETAILVALGLVVFFTAGFVLKSSYCGWMWPEVDTAKCIWLMK